MAAKPPSRPSLARTAPSLARTALSLARAVLQPLSSDLANDLHPRVAPEPARVLVVVGEVRGTTLQTYCEVSE